MSKIVEHTIATGNIKRLEPDEKMSPKEFCGMLVFLLLFFPVLYLILWILCGGAAA